MKLLLLVVATTVVGVLPRKINAAPAQWEPFVSLAGITDLTPPRLDGSFTVTAGGMLFLLDPVGTVREFARGPGGYATTPVTEAYVARARPARVPGARCAFTRDDVYALDVATPGIVRIDAAGVAKPFVVLPSGTFPNGIAFDDVGRFGHRLLVTAGVAGKTTLFAIDCHGRVRTVTVGAPAMEGGLAVAPRTFGRFGGRLIAPDEVSGRIFALDGRGRVRPVVDSGLPAGGDVGVESLGFVPPRFRSTDAAYLADRGTPGNPHPGTDHVLRLAGAALVANGVRSGDLLAATEGGAETISVRCRGRRCTIRHVADGPAVAHAEGHIVFSNAQ